ncbi:hypothetical protein DUNSADRAFT_2844 [Dunaliella salina]|uniref:Encoded protein n=1 Tax=Dunaliella salina TaxID=3046 RepID=A0ABQ7GV60_DUNSA|nr:hypothetical protein DUNSADRAFT_2844 [Dunaliella salina]|eukprot:KAF5838450.1 hypothetical protein DUNSADRAFT_2844 [Dunaliella salina]
MGDMDRRHEMDQLSLQDLPDLALAAIHEALWERDTDGFCISSRDAAAFRSTCKRLHGAVQLPRMLKLSFAFPTPDFSSLKLLLTRHCSRTQLSLRLTGEPQDEGSKYNNAEKDDDFILTDAILSHLSLLDSHLVRLELFCDDFDGYWGGDHQRLCSIMLCLTPGSVPFVFSRSSEETPMLDLSRFSSLQHFILKGPVVKKLGVDVNGGRPFILPPHTKVTIDPGLCGRRPTPWVRPVTSFERFDAMPGSAVPNDGEYREEDLDAREQNKVAFICKIANQAAQRADGEVPWIPADPLDFKAIMCHMDPNLTAKIDKSIDDLMQRSGCLYRSEKLAFVRTI